MSYYPNPNPGRPVAGPGPGPGYPPGPPPRQGRPRPPRAGGGFGCLSFILGFVTAIVIGAVVFFFLYFYNPNANGKLPRPTNAAGTPDISATLSQEYINKEIARQLPFKAGVVSLKDVVITVQDQSQIEIAMRASYNGIANFDLTVTEQVIVQSGKIKLNVVGQPKLTNGQLPIGVDAVLQQINTQFIEPKLNDEIAKIAINQRNLTLVGINSMPGLLTVQANVQT